VGADGTIYVAEYGKIDHILMFSKTHEFLGHWGAHGSGDGEFRRPMGLSIDSSGHVYVADSVNHRIQKFTRDGEFVAAWGKPGKGPGEFMYPYDVHVHDDRVLVCEYGNCRIQTFTLDGELVGAFGEPGRGGRGLSSPWSLDVARDGRVYVADMLNHRLLVLNRPLYTSKQARR